MQDIRSAHTIHVTQTPQTPITSIVGSAGIGKSRTARRLHPDAVWVDLEAVPDDASVSRAVTAAMQGAGRSRVVVLDHADHVPDGAALAARHQMAAGFVVIVTSDFPIEGATTTWRVPPMSTGEARLLLQGRHPHGTSDEVSAAVGLAAGIPLALLLISGVAAQIGLDAAAQALTAHLVQLTGTRTPAMSRQRRVEAVAAWALRALPEAHAPLLRHVATCRGGFSGADLRDVEAMREDAASARRALTDLRRRGLVGRKINRPDRLHVPAIVAAMALAMPAR